MFNLVLRGSYEHTWRQVGSSRRLPPACVCGRGVSADAEEVAVIGHEGSSCRPKTKLTPWQSRLQHA